MPEYKLADILGGPPETSIRPVPRGTPGVYQPGGPPPGVPEPWSVDGFPGEATGNLVGPFQGDAFFPDGTPTEALLDRLRFVESGGNDRAVSPAGAIGPYQIMPESGANPGYGVTPITDYAGLVDPTRSRQWAREYLTALYGQYGNPVLTLAAYNAGPGNVEKYGGVPPFAETQNYVKKFGF